MCVLGVYLIEQTNSDSHKNRKVHISMARIAALLLTTTQLSLVLEHFLRPHIVHLHIHTYECIYFYVHVRVHIKFQTAWPQERKEQTPPNNAAGTFRFACTLQFAGLKKSPTDFTHMLWCLKKAQTTHIYIIIVRLPQNIIKCCTICYCRNSIRLNVVFMREINDE